MNYMVKLYICNTLYLVMSIHYLVLGDMRYRVVINNIWLYHMSRGFMLCVGGHKCTTFKLWRVGFVWH